MSSISREMKRLKPRTSGLFINGEWIETQEMPSVEQRHPATGEVVARPAEAGPEWVDEAVAAARRAFDNGPWPTMAARERRQLLQYISRTISENAREISYLQTLDNGVPINFGLNTRISAHTAADIFDHYAGWIDKITGETFPRYTDAQNLHFLTMREPVGVVAGIIPWNAPLMMFSLKVAPALATGCTIVLKPSELANLACLRLAEIVASAGLPEGVFNLVTGGRQTGQALSTHPEVDKVTFTGSPAAGEQILSESGKGRIKRVTLELGGKSAVIVFPQTRSVRQAARAVMSLSSTFLSGQVCSTPSRAVVHRSILDEFLEGCAEQVREIQLGDPFNMATTSAPIISTQQVERVLSYVEFGRAQGAELVFGGQRLGGELGNGNWISPALFTGVKPDMRIAREEIFGPVLSVIAFDDEEEAIAIANDSDYGLSGGVYTTDLSQAFRVAKRMRTGSVGINGYGVMPNSPAGGLKRSGVGREGGWPTIEAFTELKTIVLNLDA